MTTRTWIGIAFAVVCLGSIALRAGLDDSPPRSTADAEAPAENGAAGSPSGLITGLQPNSSASRPTTEPEDPQPPEDEGGGIEDALPIVTEASFFGFLGFALGYASKKVLKLAMIFIALFFVMLQVLVFLKIAEMDWNRAIELINGLVMNIKQDRSITEVLTDRIPAAATLVGGFFLGFRRG